MAADRLDLLHEFFSQDGGDSTHAIETHVASISQGPADYERGMSMSKFDTMCFALTKWAAMPEHDDA